MSINREKFCGGCTLYEGPPPCGYLFMLEDKEICPCSECLLKTTCEVACEEFKLYAEKSEAEIKKQAEDLLRQRKKKSDGKRM